MQVGIHADRGICGRGLRGARGDGHNRAERRDSCEAP